MALKSFAPLIGWRIDPPNVNTSFPELFTKSEKLHWIVEDSLDRAVYLDYKNGIAPHMAVFGASGKGKSRFIVHLIRVWVAEGYNVLVIDPKDTTILQAVSAIGTVPEAATRLTLFSPDSRISDKKYPTMNPFLVADGDDINDTVDTFVRVMHDVNQSSWGPVLEQVLKHATQVAVCHGLSPMELVAILSDDDYRSGLLKTEPRFNNRAYRLAKDFFAQKGGFEKAGKGQSVQGVINKLDEFIRSDYYAAVFCGNDDGIDVAPRDRRAVVVHLDASRGDPKAAVIFASMLLNRYFTEAMKGAFKVPTLVVTDELGNQGEAIAQLLSKILRIGRDRNLHLLLSSQSARSLGDDLAEEVFNTVATRVFFAVGDSLANRMAAKFSKAWPKTGTSEEWAGRLTRLGNRRAVLDVTGNRPVAFLAPYVDMKEPDAVIKYVVLSKNVSPQDQEATLEDREREISRLAGRLGAGLEEEELPEEEEEQEEGYADGSLT